MGQASTDTILMALGSNGRYHRVQFIILCSLIIPSNFNVMSFIFIAKDNEHRCRDTGLPSWTYNDVREYNNSSVNATLKYGACSIPDTFNSSKCADGWIYKHKKYTSIVSQGTQMVINAIRFFEPSVKLNPGCRGQTTKGSTIEIKKWDLVCGDEVFSRLSQSVLILGQVIGALVVTKMADMFGRKLPLLASQVLLSVSALSLPFSSSITVFIVIRFFIGFAQMAMLMVRTTMVMELYPTKHRRLAGSVYVTLWMVSTVFMAPLTYVLRHESWHTLQFVLFGLTLVPFTYIWFLDESVRWLLTNDRRSSLTKILTKACKMNGLRMKEIAWLLDQTPDKEKRALPDSALTNGDDQDVNLPCDPTADQTQITCKDVISNRRLVLNFGLVSWLWFTSTSTYFSLYLTSNTLARDIYLNFFLNCVSDFPSGFLFWLLSDRIGRKKTFILFYTVSGGGLLAATVIRHFSSHDPWPAVATGMAFLGRIAIGAAFVSILLFTTEIYPTNVRNVGLGFNSTSGRIGSLVAPFTAILMKHIPWMPGVVMSLCCFLSAAAVTLLPETSGTELPHTIKQVENMHNKITRGPRPRHKDSDNSHR